MKSFPNNTNTLSSFFLLDFIALVYKYLHYHKSFYTYRTLKKRPKIEFWNVDRRNYKIFEPTNK